MDELRQNVKITLAFDQSQLDRAQQLLGHIPNGVRTAMTTAVNKTLTQGRTVISRAIRGEVNLSQKATLRAIAIRKAVAGNPEGSITVSRKPIKLGEYKPTQTKRGVRVRVRKNGAAEILPHAFITTMASGHTGVFERVGPYVVPQKGRYVGKVIMSGPNKGQPIKRQKLKELYGPTAVGVLAGKPGLLNRATEEIQGRFAKIMHSQISYVLDKFGEF